MVTVTAVEPNDDILRGVLHQADAAHRVGGVCHLVIKLGVIVCGLNEVLLVGGARQEEPGGLFSPVVAYFPLVSDGPMVRDSCNETKRKVSGEACRLFWLDLCL